MNRIFQVESIGHDIRSTQFSRGGCCDTLTANDFKDPCVVAYAIENHPCDSRVTMTDSGIVQTLNARMGTGGNNVPMVLMAEVFVQTRHAEYHTGLPLLKASGGDTGGGGEGLVCYAVDSHPMDSRIEIVDGPCPTVAAHVVKSGCDGPLVLIRRNE